MNELPDYIKPNSMRERELECVIADLKAEIAEYRAVMRQALDALVAAGLSAVKTKQVRDKAIVALREALVFASTYVQEDEAERGKPCLTGQVIRKALKDTDGLV